MLSGVNSVANHIIGGWQVNGIVTFQAGFPMTISAADVGGLNDTFRHQPGRSRWGCKRKHYTHHCEVVQHASFQTTGSGVPRQLWPWHSEFARH